MGYFYKCAKVILVSIFWLLCVGGFAQERYWVGGSGDWFDSQHWATESGGVGGTSVPGASDAVIVDQNSFVNDGLISINQDVVIRTFIWTADAKRSGLAGSGSITASSNVFFESENSLGWKGDLRLTSLKRSFLKISSKIGANIVFDANAQYTVMSSLETKGNVLVGGNNVDLQGNKVKAKRVTASAPVQATMQRSGFLRAPIFDNTTFQIKYAVVDESCPGKSDGSITVNSIDGGVAGSYTYMWYDINDQVIPGATGLALTNVKKGTYFFVVTGTSTATNSVVTNSFRIEVKGSLPLAYQRVKAVDATCNGSAGSVEVLAILGATPYTYYLNNVSKGTSSPIINVPAGTYNLKIVDGENCEYPYATPVVVGQPAAITLTLSSTDVTTCFGNTDGTITASATGGLGTIEFSRDGTNFSPTGTFAGLPAGTYTITARSSADHNCTITKSVTINQPVKLSATAAATPVSGCSATPDGQIVVSNPLGGSGVYDYSDDGGVTWSTTGTFPGLAAGTYNVIIRDRNNPTCTYTVNAALVVTANPPLSATYTSTNATCNGVANGSISFTSPQGGSGVYEYSVVAGTWVSTADFPNLAPNTYTLQIRDKNKITCSKVLGTVTITQPTALSATVSKTDVTGCYNANNGTITINNPTGGSGQYEFSVDGTTWKTTSTIPNLGPGTYPVSIRDKAAPTCVKPLGNQVVVAPVKITATFTKVDVTACAGNNNGSITFKTVAGGSGQYEYSVDNGATWSPNGTFTGLTAKSYTLVVRDKLTPTCTSPIGAANIIEPAPMTATVTPTNITCFGATTGAINITNPQGGSGVYKYSKDGGATWQNSGSFPNLPAATYQIAIQDANNVTCIKSLGSITVAQSNALTATVNVTNVAKCSGDATGAISVTNPQGGGGSYEYSKDGSTWGTTSTFSNLIAGSYPIFIRDVANRTCSVKLGDYTVTQPASIVINSVVAVDPKCFGESNGSITVNATGGTSPLSYSDGGLFQSPNLFPNLAAGTFTVTVKDAAGCTKSSDVTLNAPQKLIPTVTKTDVSCAGPNTGQINITAVAGGKAPYQYSIQGGAAGTYFPTSAFTGVAAGTYNVRVKDANNCESDITTIVVNGAVALDVTAVAVAVKPCNGDKSGAINLTINSGTAPYQYNIGAGNKALVGTSITGLAAGNYNLTITDGAGCVKNLGNIAVSEPAPIAATATVTDVTGCSTSSNGSIFIAAGGGVAPLSYSKDNGVTFVPSNNFTGLAAGTYPVKVKDANGCILSLGDKIINAPNSLTIDLNATVITNVKCNGGKTGAITVAATGGVAPLSYAIDAGVPGPSNVFTGLAAGSYTVKVSDNGGCTQTAPISITQPNALQPNVQSFNVSCSGLSDGRILVAPSGGTPNYTVTLTPTATFSNGAFTNLAAGNYTVSIQDANSCAITKDVTINQPTPITITSQNSANPTCTAAGTITVVAGGGTNPLKYSLIKGGATVSTNATGIFSNVSAGTYTVDVTDASSCAKVSTTPITLTSPSAITFSNIVAPAIDCNGASTSSISLTVSGIAGTPTVTITKGGTALPAPTVTKVGATYTVTASNLTGGSYLVTVSDSNDPTCTQSQSIDITEPAALALGTPAVVPPTSGNNGSISVTATGGTPPYTYTLNPGNLTNNTGIFSNLGAATYTLSVRDSKNCSVAAVTITLSNLTATLTTTDILCSGAKNGSIKVDMVGGVAPYSIKITYPDGTVNTVPSPTTSTTISGLDKGDYSLVITDNNGTSVTKTAKIAEPTKLTVALQNATTSLCAGVTTGKMDVAINGGTAPYTITWTGVNGGVPVTGGTLVGQSITNLSAADYVVTVTDKNGCTVTASHTISSGAAINLTVASTNPVCGNPTSGTITLTATGGTGAFSYTNDGVAFSNTTGAYTGLTAGTYTVAAKDAAGCQSTPQTVVLTTPTAINIASVTKTDTKCAIGGSITVTAAGGSGALTYNLLRAGSKVLVTTNKTGLFTDVALGNYLVEVTDGGTCPATWPATISIVSGGGTTNIKVLNYTVDNIKCFGDKGRAVINVSGVQGTLTCVFVNRTTGVTLVEGTDYNFKATPGANAGEFTIEVSGFNAGSYNMFISDDNACPQKFPFGITGPTQLTFDSVTKVDPSSKSSADGTITAVVSGGVKPYTFKLEGTTITNTTGVFTGLNPGTYKVIVEDKNHCTAVSNEVVLVAKSNLAIDDIIIVNPKCHAETNGSIDIYASGGSGALQYSIDNGKNFGPAQLFPNLKAGVYDVVVVDALGVRATQKVTLVDPEAIVVKVVKLITPSADGAYNGSIVVIATGGSGMYTYSLRNADTGAELSNATTGSIEVNFNKLPSGNYKVVVTDDNGCTGEVGPIVLEELSLDVAVTDVKCSTDAFGKLDITVKGGVEPFTLTWQPKGGVVTGPINVVGRAYSISNLAAGDYVLSVTDATNSVYTTTVTIKSPIALVAAVKNVTTPICAGTTDGIVELDITGGKPAYTITWNAETPNPTSPASVTGSVISGLHPSKYAITVTDANGCNAVVNTEITSYPPIVIDKVDVVQPKCSSDLGTITVTASGGVGALTYSTTVAGAPVQNTTGVFSNLGAGTYTITVTDTKACVKKSADVVIAVPSPIVLTITEVLNQTCTTKGKITAVATGGSGTFTYTIGAITNQTGIFDNLDAGKFKVTVTDVAGCSASSDVDVLSTATLKIANLTVQNVKCNGGTTGKITFNVEGATTGLVVTANGNTITPDAANLYTVDNQPAGTVTLVVTDNSGCNISEQHNITEPTAVKATLKVTSVPANATLNTGSIEVVASGGSGFYKISCIDKATGTELSSVNIGEGIPTTFGKLLMGTYTITVEDENGCTFSGDITIGNLAMTAKGIGGNCKDPKGSIEVAITDGAKPYTTTYTKKGDAVILGTITGDENKVTFTGVDPGDYTVKVVDNSKFEVTTDVTVPVYTVPALTLVAKCFVNNDYYMELGVPAGLKNYTVKCTDADGVAYTEYDPVTHRITKLLPNKTYTVEITDDLGCTSNVLTVDIATLPELKVSDATVTNVLCHGLATGKIVLSATGGAAPLKYSLTTTGGTPSLVDSPEFVNLLAGTYTARTVDAAGCFSEGNIQITEPATALSFTLDVANSNTNIWCATNAEGKLAYNVKDATPGYVVSIFDANDKMKGQKTMDAAGAVSFDLLAVGGYKAIAQDKNGCALEVVTNITGENIKLNADLIDSECRRFVKPEEAKTKGGSIVINSLGGNFAADAAYYFKKGKNLLTEPVTPADNLDGEGFYKFTAGTPRTISELSGVPYSIIMKVVEARGVCVEEYGFAVGVKLENDFYAVAEPDKTVCINSEVDYTAGYKFNPLYVPNVDRNMFVNWTDMPGKVSVINIKDNLSSSVNELAMTQAVTKDNLATPKILRVEMGACYDVDTAKVSVYPFVDPYLRGPLIPGVDQTKFNAKSIRIPQGGEQEIRLIPQNKDVPIISKQWNPKDVSWMEVFKPDSVVAMVNTKFTNPFEVVTIAVNTEHCTEYANMLVYPLSGINPPNAITPNGDGFNDTWRVIFDEELLEYPNLEVEIFNRWGSLIYHAKPYKNNWDGRHNGTELPTGTYYYVIKPNRGNLPPVTGSVSIIR